MCVTVINILLNTYIDKVIRRFRETLFQLIWSLKFLKLHERNYIILASSMVSRWGLIRFINEINEKLWDYEIQVLALDGNCLVCINQGPTVLLHQAVRVSFIGWRRIALYLRCIQYAKQRGWICSVINITEKQISDMFPLISFRRADRSYEYKILKSISISYFFIINNLILYTRSLQQLWVPRSCTLSDCPF